MKICTEPTIRFNGNVHNEGTDDEWVVKPLHKIGALKRKLVNIHISGIPTIARALASTKDDKNKD